MKILIATVLVYFCFISCSKQEPVKPDKMPVIHYKLKPVLDPPGRHYTPCFDTLEKATRFFKLKDINVLIRAVEAEKAQKCKKITIECKIFTNTPPVFTPNFTSIFPLS